MSKINLMKQKGGEEKKGVDDDPQAAQQSIDYMNMLHSLEESMLKDLSGKSDMFFSIIKGELLLSIHRELDRKISYLILETKTNVNSFSQS